MELHGVTISETDNYVAIGDSGEYLEFLEEVMELRAAIHTLENSPDPDLARVKQLWVENSGRHAPCSCGIMCTVEPLYCVDTFGTAENVLIIVGRPHFRGSFLYTASM